MFKVISNRIIAPGVRRMEILAQKIAKKARAGFPDRNKTKVARQDHSNKPDKSRHSMHDGG